MSNNESDECPRDVSEIPHWERFVRIYYMVKNISFFPKLFLFLFSTYSGNYYPFASSLKVKQAKEKSK